MDTGDREPVATALRKSEERYARAVRGTSDGLWDWDIVTGKHYLSPRWKELLGFADHELPNHRDSFFSRLHPEDIPHVEAAIQAHFEQRTPLDIEIRLRSKDDQYRWFQSRGQAVWDEAGHPVYLAGFISDISDRKLAELERQERAAIFDSCDDAILGKTLDGIITSWNPAAERLYGYTREEAIGKSIDLIIPQERSVEFSEIMERIRRGERVKQLETVRKSKEGLLIPVSVTISPIRNAQGQIIGASSIARDLTERNEAEVALAEERERLAKVIATTPGVVCSFRLRPDRTSSYPLVNPRIEEIYGLAPEDLARDASPVFALMPPEDAEHVFATVAESARTLSPWRAEFRVFHLKRGEIWVEGNSMPMHEADGSILWQGILTDITQRKQSEAHLLTNARCLLWSGIVEEFENGSILWKADVTDLAVAQAFCPLELKPGENYKDVAYRHRLPEDRVVTDRIALQALRGGLPEYVVEFRQGDADGNLRWFVERVSIEEQPVCPAPEDVVRRIREWRVVGVCTEITQSKQAEEALREAHEELESRVAERTRELLSATKESETARREAEVARAEAESANKAKSEFLSRMSHELRTPLNAILGFGQILERQDLTARQQESIQYILSGGHHLLALIDEILDIARVEAGRVELAIEPIILGTLVAESWALLRPLATERDLQFTETVSTQAPLFVRADRQRLKQVLINLLSNAIKYNREGGTITVLCHELPNEQFA